MTLTLHEYLEIDRKLVQPDDLEGWKAAELIWLKNDQPRGIQRLIDVLEVIMEDCRRVGIRYPKVLLKRKKEMERGIWKPGACATKPIGIAGKSAAEKRLGI